MIHRYRAQSPNSVAVNIPPFQLIWAVHLFTSPISCLIDTPSKTQDKIVRLHLATVSLTQYLTLAEWRRTIVSFFLQANGRFHRWDFRSSEILVIGKLQWKQLKQKSAPAIWEAPLVSNSVSVFTKHSPMLTLQPIWLTRLESAATPPTAVFEVY